ncbi:hypothetical protein N7540_005767 [Penicillium herquei]|nr:hypothetical protein N7540_005767 [Penicillium herquei]
MHIRRILSSLMNHTLELDNLGDSRRFYDDLVDEGGINLSDIPEDFSKAPGTVKQQERIETWWEWYCISQIQSKPNKRK